MRSKYQNIELIKRVKLFLTQVHSAGAEPSLELTQTMLNPPVIKIYLKNLLYDTD